jgi:hypothetical protein
MQLLLCACCLHPGPNLRVAQATHDAHTAEGPYQALTPADQQTFPNLLAERADIVRAFPESLSSHG